MLSCCEVYACISCRHCGHTPYTISVVGCYNSLAWEKRVHILHKSIEFNMKSVLIHPQMITLEKESAPDSNMCIILYTT